ncbi:hypothetical protein [Tahibacter aquaticus]|uniref:hypothetical protein n=1 Tax=Tahibacter aquaticus TaxID=520092 RepID=UPI0014152DAB|nr:hypothetical protein [Tahibacter aquaticus]
MAGEFDAGHGAGSIAAAMRVNDLAGHQVQRRGSSDAGRRRKKPLTMGDASA